jgi:hypothetical protein
MAPPDSYGLRAGRAEAHLHPIFGANLYLAFAV